MRALRVPEQRLTDGTVRLRPWRDADVRDLVEACRDPEIPRWTVVPTPYSAADARAFVAGQNERLTRGEAAPFAVVGAEGGDFLGSVEVTLLDRRSGRGEIGYWVAPWARRRGVALRAVSLVSAWALSDLDLERLELLVEPDNEPSQRVAEAAGFTREGILRSYRPMKGRRPDFVLYSLLATDPAALELLERGPDLLHTAR
ncbi:MAG TPA: GNAT family N-acetyltransferase [Thermoleophilaceae bacterium]|nr:GNAT family N-acetyltransferase [Thermoleophilaceae bacterium]